MKIVVVGGSGHIGTFLVPRLVGAGHEVVSLSRGATNHYAQAPEWEQVQRVAVDREEQDREGTFAATVLALQPDVVVDLVCFTLESATALVEGLRGRVGHLLHCGSIWRHGPSQKLPITEDRGTPPVGEYGIGKARIAQFLKEETASGGLVTTSLHPGHIVGPGWPPIGPLGNLDPAVWAALSAGERVRVPGDGTQSMHHVHADDVAQAFALAIENPAVAGGEDFTVTAPTAVNVRGFAQIAARWFGQEAVLEPVSWEEFRAGTSEEHAGASWEHLHRNHVFSIDKARTLLGYAPAYEPEAAVLESVRWLVENDRLQVPTPLR